MLLQGARFEVDAGVTLTIAQPRLLPKGRHWNWRFDGPFAGVHGRVALSTPDQEVWPEWWLMRKGSEAVALQAAVDACAAPRCTIMIRWAPPGGAGGRAGGRAGGQVAGCPHGLDRTARPSPYTAGPGRCVHL